MLRRGNQPTMTPFEASDATQRAMGVLPPPTVLPTEGMSDPISNEHFIDSDDSKLGADFSKRVGRELDKALTGEEEAKLAYKVVAVAGGNLLLIGATGIGKTVLLREAQRLFDDSGDHTLRSIPPQSDLTGKEVTGGTVSSHSRVVREGVVHEETTTTTIEAILDPRVRKVSGDEINRTNPTALGAMLEGLESRRVTNNTGVIDLSQLEFAVFAVNPRSVDRTVYPLGQAFVSRMAGVELGKNPYDDDEILTKGINRELSQPQLMKAVTSYDELQRLRLIADRLRIPGQYHNRVKQILIGTRLTLKETGIEEGLGRITEQTMRMSGALALLGGKTIITTGDVLQAVKFKITAMVGALDTPRTADDAFRSLLDSIHPTQDEEDAWYVSSRQR